MANFSLLTTGQAGTTNYKVLKPGAFVPKVCGILLLATRVKLLLNKSRRNINEIRVDRGDKRPGDKMIAVTFG